MVVCVLPACCLPACLPPFAALHRRLSLPQHCIPAGDCDFKMEVMRGNLAVRGQFQKCVRRRAELSGEGVGGWGGVVWRWGWDGVHHFAATATVPQVRLADWQLCSPCHQLPAPCFHALLQ